MITNRTGATLPLTAAETSTVRQAHKALSRVETATMPEYLHFSELPADIAIPKAALPLIAQILDAMSNGEQIRLLAKSREVSPQDAAEILGVSRPFFVHLLNHKHIPFRYVGTHRRVRLSDLLAYQAEQERRGEIMAQLTAEAQELDMGY